MRGLLLFARSPEAEARAKGLSPVAGRIFRSISRSWRRVAETCAARLIVASQQCGRTFGERLANSVDDAFTSGITSLVVVGIDTPSLAASQIDQVFADLESGRVTAVVGPASDGGVYLIGLRCSERGLLVTIRIGQPNLMDVFRTYFHAGMATLPLAADLDSPADLPRLAKDTLWCAYWGLLRELARPTWPDQWPLVLPHTAAVLLATPRAPPALSS